jgi:hypothetical protein
MLSGLWRQHSDPNTVDNDCAADSEPDAVARGDARGYRIHSTKRLFSDGIGCRPR